MFIAGKVIKEEVHARDYQEAVTGSNGTQS